LKVGSFSVLIRGTKSDALIYAVGRQANGDQLNLEAAGVTVGSRGRLKVNEYFPTEVPHIYAAGDVIGFPALASTSMEQGRLTASHMFGLLFGHQSRGVSRGADLRSLPKLSRDHHANTALIRCPLAVQ